MASVFDANGRYTAGLDLPEPEPGYGEGATWSDIGRRALSSTAEAGSQAASLTQYTLEQFGMPNAAKMAKSASQLLHIGGDIAEEGITPGGQRSAGIEGYKEAPFSTFLMQAAGVAPAVAIMSIVPGGFIGEGLAGSGMLAGQVVDQAIAKSNNLSDAQKQDRIPFYKYLRTTKGMSEDQAVREYHKVLVPYKDFAVASLIGAATMGAGARLLKNGAIVSTGRLKGAVEAGTEAAVGGGVAAGTADVEQQRAESVEKSPTGTAADTDWNRTLSTSFKAGVDNGIIGIAGGGLHGGKGKEPEVTIPAEETAPPPPPEPPPPPPESQNMQPPPGLQHDLPLPPPKVAATTPPVAGQADLFPAVPTGHSGVVHDADGNVVGQAPPPPSPGANPPPAPPTAPVAPPPPLTPHSGAVTDAEGQTVGQAPIPAVPTGDLPLKPPAYAPTAEAPAGQGDLFGGEEPQVTIPAEATGAKPLPPSPDEAAAPPTAPSEPGPSLADIHAATTGGAVDTSTAPPPAEAPKPKRTRKPPKAAVQEVPTAGPDADQSAALGASGVGKPPEAETAPVGKATEAVPTTPAPPTTAADEPATAAEEGGTKGVPDEHTATSQPPKGAGTGAPGAPAGAGEPVGTTAYVKPGAKGAAKKTGRGKPPPPPPEPVAEVPAAEAAALTPEVNPPAPPPAPPAEPAPPPPAPAAAAPPQPAPPQPAPPQPAPGPSLADIHAQVTGQPPVASPLPEAAPAVPAPAAAPRAKTLEDIMAETTGAAPAADVPAPDAEPVSSDQPPGQGVATQTGVRETLPSGQRILEGGSAAPAYDARVLAETKKASDTALAGEARADKLTPRDEPQTKQEATNEKRRAVTESRAAVAKAEKAGTKAHPIHQEINDLSYQATQGGGMGQKGVSGRMFAAVARLREAHREGGELGPRGKADVNLGGAPVAKVGEVTRGGVHVTEKTRAAMDRGKTGRQSRKAKLTEAAQKARDEELARQRASQDAAAKPFSAEKRHHLEVAATDPNRSPAERAKAAFALEQDDINLARRETASYVRPEPVEGMKQAAAADRQKIPEPSAGASEAEWRAWMKKTLDVETEHIERGSLGGGGGEEGEALHEVAAEPTVDDPKGLARQLMQMQLQDTREMTSQHAMEAVPLKLSRRMTGKPRSLTADQLKTVRDDASNPRSLREYAARKHAEITDTKAKKITTPRVKKAGEVTPEVKPERAGAKNVNGIWKPTIAGVVLEDRAPYRNYGDALRAAEREAQHRVRPTEAVAAEGVDTTKSVRGIESVRDDLVKANAARREEIKGHETAIAASEKEIAGHQSLLDRKALGAEAKAAGMKVGDFRKSLDDKITAGRGEIDKTRGKIETIQAEHETTRARIKDFNAYLEHPETQQRRAEEVEEKREKSRPTAAPSQGAGGARLGGRKSMADILKEVTGDDEDETVTVTRKPAEAPQRKGVGPAGEKAIRTAKARPTAGTSDVLNRIEKAFDEGQNAGRDKRRRMEMPEGIQLAKPGDGEGRPSVTIKVRGHDFTMRVNHTDTVSNTLESARTYIHGLTRTGEIADSVLKRVQKLAGDVAVHYVDASEFERMGRADPSTLGAAAIYDYGSNKIFVRDDIRDPDTLSHVVFHEAIHAATSKVLDANPGFRAQIKSLMDEAKLIGIQYDRSSKYAFTDEHEFLAEAFSNKAFRDKLASYDISPELKKTLALEGWRKATGFKAQLRNLWDALKYSISNALGEPKASSFLEATLATTERVMKEHERTRVPVEDLAKPTVKAIDDSADPEKAHARYMKMPDAVHDIGEKLSHLAPGSDGRRLGFAFRTGDQLRQGYEHRFGARTEDNPLRNFTESIEKAGVKAHVYNRDGQALSKRVYDLAAKNPDVATEFASLAEGSTIHNVHLDRANDHLKDATLGNAQSRAMLPQLKARFDAMVKAAPETKQLWADAVKYFQDTHDAMASKLIDNHLETVADAHTAVGGIAGLKQRLFNGTATKDDMALFSRGQADSFAQMREIHKMEGAYFPLMRRGDFAVQAEMKVNPGAGTLVEPNVVQFTNEKQAHDYAAKSPLKVLSANEIWVDQNGNRVSSKSAGAVKAYQIEVQHKYLSFHEKEHEALARQAELKADPGVAKVSDIQRKQNNPGYDVSLSSPQVQAIIRSIRQNDSIPAAKKEEMIRSWIDVSHRLMAGNRVEARRLPRRNVLGASMELGRNIGDYSSSTSAYRAKLEFSQPIHDALARMEKEHADLAYSGDNQATMERGDILREMKDRLYGGLEDMNTKTNKYAQMLTTTTYFKSMASPAHMLLHSTHPWMISMPVLGARHGFIKSSGALSGAYRDMGGLGAVKEGMKAFARQVRAGGTAEAKNWLDHFEAEFRGKDKGDVIKMWRALAETGDIHPEAGMEAHRMDPAQSGKILGGLRRVDAMLREMTSTSEALNRFAESAAAYRLERMKGKTHEEAVRYAKDTLRNTQGLYSRTNVPRLFRNKWTRPFLQFKQFPQMIYNLLAKSAYQAFKGETPEIRREAMRQFAGVVGTHALMAGALGLPTEPIRAVMMLANAMGVPGMDWKEHEDQITKWLAAKYGPQAAEIIMHGLTRALGPASIDVHHRLGLGTPLLGTEPRGSSETDIKSYLYDMILGAPGGLAYDSIIKGPQEILSGHTAQGLEHMLPFKALTDPIKAAAGYLGGKQTARGNQVSPPLNGVQTFMQTIGFVPGAVAQANAATASMKQTQFRESQERTSIINQAVAGGKFNGADIARWNAAHPEHKISYSSLTTARREAALPQALGQKINKGNRALADETSRAYNLGGVQ